MTPERISRRLQYALHERLAPPAMKFQLLIAFDQRAEVAEQRIVIFTRETQVTLCLCCCLLKDEHPDAHKDDHAAEHGPWKPTEVSKTGDQDRRLHADRGNAEQRVADGLHVVVERREETMRTDLFELTQGSSEDLTAQAHAQIVDCCLHEMWECHLRSNATRRQDQPEGDEAP